MPKPRLGVIPRFRLADARRVRDEWRPAFEETGGTLNLSVREDGFGLHARFPEGVDTPRVRSVDGVPIRITHDRAEGPRS